MKYNLNAKRTKGADRVLNACFLTLFRLLLEKPFEEITVNEICEKSGYPRATFYNYFDDKYDLLNFFWYRVAKEIKVEDFGQIPTEKLLFVYYDRMYDLCERFNDDIRRIWQNNAWDSYFFVSCKVYLNSQLKMIIGHLTLKESNPIPQELMVEHYGNTLLMIFEWRFGKENDCDKEHTWQLVDYLLKDL